MPGTAITEATWLDQYDAYYYDRDDRKSLPVVRVRYADPDEYRVEPHGVHVGCVLQRVQRLDVDGDCLHVILLCQG